MQIRFHEDDITACNAGIILCPIPSDSSLWISYIDQKIHAVADRYFHCQIPKSGQMQCHGECFIAQDVPTIYNTGSFKAVLFICDDGVSNIADLLYSAYVHASSAGFSELAIPILRSETRIDRDHEPATPEELAQMMHGIVRCMAHTPPTSHRLHTIHIVASTKTGRAQLQTLESGLVRVHGT